VRAVGWRVRGYVRCQAPALEAGRCLQREGPMGAERTAPHLRLARCCVRRRSSAPPSARGVPRLPANSVDPMPPQLPPAAAAFPPV
jgi:hypothetical protein